MSRHLSWKHGYRYCQGQNSRGYPCGNLVPQGYRYCRHHRQQATLNPKASVADVWEGERPAG